MSHCRHDHGHQKGKNTADILTVLNTGSEFLTSFISGSYWIGEGVDLIFQLDELYFGLSLPSLIVGPSLSLVLAIGTAYSHYVLNTNHQKLEQETHQHTATADEENQLPPAEALEPEKGSINSTEGSPLLEIQRAAAVPPKPKKATLSWLQKVALGCDFFSHSIDAAAVPTFVGNLAANNTMPMWGKATLQGLSALYGAGVSLADLRTCKNSMLKRNQQELNRETELSHVSRSP